MHLTDTNFPQLLNTIHKFTLFYLGTTVLSPVWSQQNVFTTQCCWTFRLLLIVYEKIENSPSDEFQELKVLNIQSL